MKVLEDFRNSAELIKANGFVAPGLSLFAEFPEEKKLIILVDIVGFSKFSTREQVYSIYLLQHYLLKKVLTNRFSFGDKIRVSDFIPTGDGCYIVADECEPETALDFLVTLVGGFQYVQTEKGNFLSLRASALIGSCVPFLDMSKRKNYIGEGMNEAARILAYGQKVLEDDYSQKNDGISKEELKAYSKNSLFLGESLAENLDEYKDYYNEAFEFKDVADKHGRKRNIWCLRGLF